MGRYKVKAGDAEQFHRIKDLVDGRATVFMTYEPMHFMATGDLPPDLERALIAAGAIITPDVTYAPEKSAPWPAETAPAVAPSAVEGLLDRLRTRPALGLSWTRDALYGAGA